MTHAPASVADPLAALDPRQFCGEEGDLPYTPVRHGEDIALGQRQRAGGLPDAAPGAQDIADGRRQQADLERDRQNAAPGKRRRCFRPAPCRISYRARNPVRRLAVLL